MTPEQYVYLRDQVALLKAKATAALLHKAGEATFVPPAAVRSAAARGLALREKWNRGGLSNSEASDQGIGSGVQRAVNLKNGDSISLATVKRMHAFFSRHQKNYRPDDKEPDGGPTAGTVAWLLWGGNAGKAWADGIVGRIEKARPSKPMEFAKDGNGGSAPAAAVAAPASGPSASDVHVPTTQWSGKAPKKGKSKATEGASKMSDELERIRTLRKAMLPSEGGMQPFVNMLLMAAVTAHQHHFSVNGIGSDAAHRALEDLYNALPDFADDLAEAYMGIYGQFPPPGGSPLEFAKSLQSSIKAARSSLPQDSELQNIIDDMLKTVDRTVYRLANLQ